MNNPAILEAMEELCRNSNIGKYRHLNAAKRHFCNNKWLSIAVITINVILSSTFFYTLSEEIPGFAKWLSGILGFASVLLVSINAFFNHRETAHIHRVLANSYIIIAQECDRYIAQFKDGRLDIDSLIAQHKSLTEKYQGVNEDALASPTNDFDFKIAIQDEDNRRKWRDEREQKRVS